jgi:hypothetical protein
MNLRPLTFVAFLSFGGLALAQADTLPVIVTGEVVRVEPGKMIVLRSSGKEVTYSIAPGYTLPAEVATGRTVSLETFNNADGSSVVKRVTTSVTPEGDVKRTTDVTRTSPSGETSQTTMTTINGQIDAYVPGKTITVTDSHGKRVTYMLSADSQIPADVVLHKQATILTVPKHDPKVMYVVERDGDVINALQGTWSITEKVRMGPNGALTKYSTAQKISIEGESWRFTSAALKGKVPKGGPIAYKIVVDRHKRHPVVFRLKRTTSADTTSDYMVGIVHVSGNTAKMLYRLGTGFPAGKDEMPRNFDTVPEGWYSMTLTRDP